MMGGFNVQHQHRLHHHISTAVVFCLLLLVPGGNCLQREKETKTEWLELLV